MRKHTQTRTINVILPVAAALFAVGCLTILCSYAAAQDPGPPPPPKAGEPNPNMSAPPPDRPEGPPPLPPKDGPPDKARGPRACEDGKQGPDGRPCPRGFEGPQGPPPPMPGREFEGHGRPAMDPVKLFKEMDANGDGVISKDEFLEFYARIGLSHGIAGAPPDGPEGRHDRRPFAHGMEGRQGPPPDGPDRRLPARGMDGPQGPPPDRPGPPPQEPRDLH